MREVAVRAAGDAVPRGLRPTRGGPWAAPPAFVEWAPQAVRLGSRVTTDMGGSIIGEANVVTLIVCEITRHAIKVSAAAAL